MHDASAALARAAATTTPSPAPTVDPELVTPGPAGFVAIAVVAIAAILLIGDMMRRIRRGRVRADIREELEAEMESEAQADAATRATRADDQDVDRQDDPPTRA